MSTPYASLTSSRHWRQFREVVLFITVGISNTAVDFAVLNLLIALTHYRNGPWLLAFNSLSFLAATTNSYIWNGRVTFRMQAQGGSWRFIRFVALNAVGLSINSVTVGLITPVMASHFPLFVAVNVSKALATVLSLSWNYFAFKRWIYRRGPAVASIEQQEKAMQFYRAAQGENQPT
jgi:putative flippase GtrA